MFAIRSARLSARAAAAGVAASPAHSAVPTRRAAVSFSTCSVQQQIWADASADVVAKRLDVGHADAEKVVLLDFTATWCPPCHMLAPHLKSVVNRKGTDLLVVDVDKEPELSQRFKVRAMPTVVAYRRGQEVSRFVGAQSEAQVEQFVDQASK
ncbi:hypothetical protein OC834_001611 [Tilletia horrida]|nr:hypothetical protein OC834_001611 [Tilletia horrida]